MKSPALVSVFVLIISLSALGTVHAGSATWNANAVDNNWNNPANWTPATVPNGPNDVATFGGSNITALIVRTPIEVNSIVFDSGASPFKINPNGHLITISGSGVVNSSGITQNFVINTATTGFVYFKGSATAGDLVQYTQSGGLPIASQNLISFFDNSTAGTSTFIVNGGLDAANQFGGILSFWDNSSADNSTIMANGGGERTNGGNVYFNGTSTASHARIFANGATETNGSGGFVLFEFATTTADQAVITAGGSDVGGAGSVSFQDSATAGNATLIAEPGQNAGGGIGFSFLGNPTGGTAKINLVGNGTLTSAPDSVEIGSLEGDGSVTLGFLTGANLSVGTNNLSTIFSGLIQQYSGSAISTLTKIGSGMLKLSGANTYKGGTTVSEGGLVINNTTGSGTGTGAVQVNGGVLAGSGTIAGPVTVGTGFGTGAFLSPGMGASTATTLTIQSALTFKADGIFTCRLNTKKTKADQVIANGVTIESGAQFAFKVTGDDQLRTGKSATVISNTAATPISGTFANLPDGSIFTVGQNAFQVSYSGGDGNDLTLTVVP